MKEIKIRKDDMINLMMKGRQETKLGEEFHGTWQDTLYVHLEWWSTIALVILIVSALITFFCLLRKE